MSDVSLFDPLTPYFFAGVDLGPGVNDILALLHIDELDAAWDEDGVVLWGVARIDSDDPSSFLFSPHSGGGPIARDASGQPVSEAEVWEWHDLSVRFRLTVSRQAADVLVATDVTDSSLRALLQALGNTSSGSRSDYPGTQFRLELLLNLVTITLPGLRGAKLEPNGLLVDDPANPRVKLKLPRILLIVTQGSTGPDAPFNVDVGSFGASGFDGQSQAILDLIEMEPPYALAGTENVFGFGFRSLIIDLDDSQTPPELLDNFGVGEDWQGVYLPEVRIFIAPSGLTGFAVSAGVREMLIGIRNTPGLWGDFIVDVINQGDRLIVEPRVVDAQRRQLPGGLFSSDAAARRDEWVFGSVPDEASLLIDVISGAAPYTIKGVFGRSPDDPIPTDTEFDAGLDLSVSQHHNVSGIRQQVAIRVTTRNPSQRRILLIDLFPRSAEEERRLNPGPTNNRASLNKVGMPPAHDVVLSNADQEQVTLTFTPPEGASLRVAGQPVTVQNGVAVVRVPMAGTASPIALEFGWTVAGTREPKRLDAYFEFDHPETNETGVVMKTQPGPSGDSIASSSALSNFLSLRTTGASVRVDGFASFEDSDNSSYDSGLSLRRANALADLLRSRGVSEPITVTGFGHDGHPLTSSPPLTTEQQNQVRTGDSQLDVSGSANVTARGTSESVRKLHWRAMASYTRDSAGTPLTATGTLSRPAPTPPARQTPRDVAPVQGQRPDFLREIGATVRILQSEFVALEIRGKVDFHTASERGLEQFRGTPQPGVEIPDRPIPERTNPEDGVVDFRLNISRDDTTNTWTERLHVQAGAGDRDGLFAIGSIPTADAPRPPDDAIHVGKDLLGFYFAIAPLAASVARPEPDAGDIVALTATLTAPLIVTALDIAHVLQFTLYGIEVAFKHHGAFEDGKLAVLFDVESAIWLNFKLGDSFRIVTCRPDKPVRLRYKAVGFTINAGFDDSGPFVPVFDASRGYTIDLADSGSLKVLPDLPGPLGDIIQIMGARIARTNPLNLEVEMGLAVDLGVFKLDKFGFRLPIDPLGAPTLTALGVSVDVPNTIVGKGRLEINSTGFAGQVDVSLPSVKLRIAAGLAVSSIEDATTGRTATGVFLSLRIELPAGIPLAGTGLGIFGFLGLFAMHYARLEPTTGNDKALRWLKDVVQGDPTDIRGWGPKLDSWAFGAGILLGTLEGAYVVRMTGLFALELPGPRLLFFLRADLLNTEPPKGVKSESGTLLAALDIDFGAGTICVGIQVDYKLQPILELMVPVEGFFDINNPDHFYVDIGSIARPITAKVLEVFKATAYLMLHGDGIPDFPLGALQGFSVAAGFHVSLEWGVKEINLYLEVAAGFDAGVGFAPFFIAGRVYLRGALHLFIVSIEARGELQAQSDGKDTWLFGEVCGSVDLFFFEIEGCVSFELGVKPGTPHAPSLIRGLALQSRSPALVRGSGLDRGIDTVLARGTEDGSVPMIEDEQGVPRQAFVPIDAIPLLQFEVIPELGAGFSIEGDLVGALPGGNDGWRKRGEILVRYRLTSIQLSSPGLANPVGPGERPNTWRQTTMDRTGDAPPIDLAMLDWSPDATPKAFEPSDARDATVDDRYDTLCDPIAPPAPVLWSFQRTPIGESPVGWQLAGEAWPDPQGSRRSVPVSTNLKVTETWRTNSLIDGMRSVVPARIVGTFVPCPPTKSGTPSKLVDSISRQSFVRLDPRLVDAAPLRIDDRVADTLAAQDLLIERTTLVKATSELRDSAGVRLLGSTPVSPLMTSRMAAAKLITPITTTTATTTKVPIATIPSAKIPIATPILPKIDITKVPIGTTPKPVEQPQQPVQQPPPVSRPADMRLAPSLITTTDKRGCPSRLLVAPFEHLGVDRAPPDLAKQLAELILEQQSKQLSDVIRFEGGPLHSFRMLAVLRSKMASSGLYQAQAFDAEGQPVDVKLTITPVTDASVLPANWREQTGPWFDDVYLAMQLLGLISRVQDWQVALVEFELGRPARAIEFGVLPLTTAIQKFGLVYPAYMVALMEGLAEAEVQRAADDQAEATDDAEGLEGALNQDPAARALLVPGRRYDVTARWVAEVAEQKDDGSIHVLRGEESFSKTHSFYTDAEPPKRLEPWLLCQFPSPDERHHFYDEPIILVFGTDDLTQLFGAYGRDLRGVVRDSSFRPPAASPLRLETFMLLQGAVMQKLGGVVFSPWEQTVRSRLGGRSCGNFNPDSPRHERAVLGLHMEPLSEYVFDVEAPRKSDGVVPPPPPNTIVQPLHRQSLATSRWAKREAMAAAIHQSYLAKRRLANAAPLLALPDVCPDESFDAALIEAGLGVAERPNDPRVTILWNDATPATPVAILIDTPEPLWRKRLEPEPTRDATGRVIAWELVEKTWLSVEELVPSGGGVPGKHLIATLPFVRRSTGTRIVSAPTLIELRDRALHPPNPTPPPPAPAFGSQVQRFVHDSSGCRTLVVLGPNARGRTVSLGLVRTLHPLIDPDATGDPVPMLDVFLERAPWEVSP